MGRWGTTVVSRDRWDAAGFEAQTPAFVAAVHDNVVDFGYQGQRSEVGRAIPVPARPVVPPEGAGADDENRGARASTIKPA